MDHLYRYEPVAVATLIIPSTSLIISLTKIRDVSIFETLRDFGGSDTFGFVVPSFLLGMFWLVMILLRYLAFSRVTKTEIGHLMEKYRYFFTYSVLKAFSWLDLTTSVPDRFTVISFMVVIFMISSTFMMYLLLYRVREFIYAYDASSLESLNYDTTPKRANRRRLKFFSYKTSLRLKEVNLIRSLVVVCLVLMLPLGMFYFVVLLPPRKYDTDFKTCNNYSPAFVIGDHLDIITGYWSHADENHVLHHPSVNWSLKYKEPLASQISSIVTFKQLFSSLLYDYYMITFRCNDVFRSISFYVFVSHLFMVFCRAFLLYLGHYIATRVIRNTRLVYQIASTYYDMVVQCAHFYIVSYIYIKCLVHNDLFVIATFLRVLRLFHYDKPLHDIYVEIRRLAKNGNILRLNTTDMNPEDLNALNRRALEEALRILLKFDKLVEVIWIIVSEFLYIGDRISKIRMLYAKVRKALKLQNKIDLIKSVTHEDLDFYVCDGCVCSLNPNKKEQELEMCPICLGILAYSHSPTTIKKLECGHMYHLQCLEDWIVNGNERCPMCNESMFSVHPPIKAPEDSTNDAATRVDTASPNASPRNTSIGSVPLFLPVFINNQVDAWTESSIETSINDSVSLFLSSLKASSSLRNVEDNDIGEANTLMENFQNSQN